MASKKADKGYYILPCTIVKPLPSFRKMSVIFSEYREVKARKDFSFQKSMIFKCSSSIFSPIKIKIAPPAISAFDLNLAPNTFPIFTPARDMANVTTPMNETAVTISMRKKANETPTASASMLVAKASGSICASFTEVSPAGQTSFLKLPTIIFPPRKQSKANAIQWS